MTYVRFQSCSWYWRGGVEECMVLYPTVTKLELMSPASFRRQAHFDMRQRLMCSAIINDALDEVTEMYIQGLPSGELHKVI